VNCGNERSQKVRKVREQEGSSGCRAAHDREVMSGCAGEVSGEMVDSDAGSMSSLLGNRMGEMNGLMRSGQLRWVAFQKGVD
jgi:hypothetical protein